MMKARIRGKCKTCIVARRIGGCLFGCDPMEKVTRELDALMATSSADRHPIEEQLTKCPEAFRAGELIEKMFSAARFGCAEGLDRERLLPPAGTIIPPLV
jgi:hypothetical protein